MYRAPRPQRFLLCKNMKFYAFADKIPKSTLIIGVSLNDYFISANSNLFNCFLKSISGTRQTMCWT